MDPFIQLSPTQSHVSNSSSSTSGNGSQSHQSAPSSIPSTSPSPNLSTHNTQQANYHVKDIGEFARNLEISANRAFPNRGLTRYKSVQVLLLRWEEDELQVEWELDDLAKVFRDYKFETETWLIPTESPLRKMMGKALQFVEDYESEDTLLIIYYGGHARINEARQSTWSCTRNLAYSSFEWNGCQALFEQSKSDTLLLLDCCSAAAAAAAVPCRTNSITEIIAACGWETWAPEPGRHSFTNTLIEVLEDWVDRKSFSAAMLHCEVLSILKQPRPRKNREFSKTPVYIVSTSNPKTYSIELSRRSAETLVGGTNQATDPTSSSSCQPQLSTSMLTDAASSQGGVLLSITGNADKFDLSSLIATLPDKTFTLPHVIMSVALETDQTLDLDGFQQWMRAFPALAKYARVEGVYQSHSTLVLLLVPVVVWNMLPEDPAYNFVGYARSTNLLEPNIPSQILEEVDVAYAQDDASSQNSWDSSETVHAGNSAVLKNALIAKYLTLEGERLRYPPSLPSKDPFYHKYGPGVKMNFGNEDQNGPLGLSTLFSPSKPAIADLVFVHGLGGGSRKTWMKSDDNSSYWPKAWLPRDGGFQDIRIHSFGYEDWNWKKDPSLNIDNFAEALLTSIQDCPLIPRKSHTPLVFVCHSMGGLVVKRAYIFAQQNEEFLLLTRRVQTILFLATPHRGSDLVQPLTRMLALTSGIKPPVADLHRNSLAIQSINEEFRNCCESLRIISFFETVPTSSGLTKGFVVEKESATMGIPNERVSYLNASHRAICKYDDILDSNYMTVRNALAAAVDEIRTRDARLRQELEEVQKRRLGEALSVPHDLEDDFANIDSQRMPGSCQWLIGRPSFQQWQNLSEDMKIYWIRGNPGTGKTVLCGKVIAHLRSLGLDCSFHFFKYGDKSKSTISSFLLSMAWQMCRLNPVLLPVVLNICEKNDQLSKADYRVIWRVLFLNGIFRTTPQQPQYWVIDALDECTSEDELVQMFSKLPVQGHLRIFLTSRTRIGSHGVSITPEVGIVSQEILADDTKPDIELYLKAKMSNLPSTDIHSQYELISTILGKSNACFLWVSLILQELSYAHTTSDVRRILEDVPSDMNVLYSRVLAQMSTVKYGKELAKAILTWTVCSARPLKTDELSSALTYDLNEHIDSIERSITAMCGQLVYIDSKSRVQMIHQTARDFLLSPSISSDFAIDGREAHTRLFMTCMKYLSGAEMKPSTRNRGLENVPHNPSAFGEYACTMSFRHLVHVSSADDEVMAALTRFLSSSRVLVWIAFAARHSDLDLLIGAGKALKHYLQRRSKYTPLMGREQALVGSWSNDLVRLVTKFGKHLLASPDSIYTLISPFCPQDTALREQSLTTTRSLSVLGPVATTWDECLSTIVAPQSQFVALACVETKFALGMADGRVAIYNQATCQELRSLQHQEAAQVLRFGQEGDVLATGGAHFVRVWDLTSGTQLWEFSILQQCLSLEFEDHDNLLLCVLRDNCLIKLDKTTGTMKEMIDWTDDIESIPAYPSRRPIFAKICSEQSLLAVSYRGMPVILWDLDGHSVYQTCSRQSEDAMESNSQVKCVAFGRASTAFLLAASYEDGDLVLLDTLDLQIIERTRANAQVLACSPDGRNLASGDSGGIIQIFDFETLKLLYRLETEYSSIQHLEFSGDGHYLLSISEWQCQVWEPTVLSRDNVDDEDSGYASVFAAAVENKSVLRLSDGAVMITSMTVHGNGEDIFCGKRDGSVYLYKSSSGSQTRKLFSHANDMSVVSIYFDSESETLVSVDDSSRIMVHRYTQRLIGKEELELLFDHESPATIHQVLGNAGHTLLLISRRTEDTLWTISKDGNKVTETIKWDRRGSFKWARHPSNIDLLVLINGNAFYVYEWSTLKRIGPSDTSLVINTPRIADVTPIKSCFGPNLLATLFKDLPASNTPCGGFLWVLSNFSKDSPSTLELKSYPTLDDQVRHLIGYYSQRLLYLDLDGWVCSFDLQSTKTTSHFFLPNDWLAISNDALNIEVTVKGDVIFAKGGEVAVIKRGLKTSLAAYKKKRIEG